MGLGLGTIIFCFQGLFKMQSFNQSKNKFRYVYLLTPAGVAEKSKLTAEFPRRKVAEYQTLQAEMAPSKADMNSLKGGPQ